MELNNAFRNTGYNSTLIQMGDTIWVDDGRVLMSPSVRGVDVERFLLYDRMNFDRPGPGPFAFANESSRHFNWRLDQTGDLRQKLDRRNRPAVDVSLFDLFNKVKAIL
jgi:hypothetical protein